MDIDDIFEQAIRFCSQKSGKTSKEITNLLRRGDTWVHSTNGPTTPEADKILFEKKVS